MSEVTVTPDPGSPTGGIQEAIDDLLTVNSGGVVKVPPGWYQISHPIIVGKPGTTSSVWLRGLGGESIYGDLGGVRVLPQYTDNFGIGIQGGKGSRISGIQVQGPVPVFQTIGVPEADESQWDVLGSTERYKPFALFAVDPLSGGDPGNAYVPPPGWSWNQAHSSFITFERCSAIDGICGVAIKPSGDTNADKNGDFVEIKDCNIIWCKYGVTANGANTRLTRTVGGSVASCWTAFAPRTFGVQRGSSMYAEFTSFDNCARVIHHWLSSGTVISFRSCFGERLGALGSVRGGSVAGTLTFDDCHWFFEPATATKDIGSVWPYHLNIYNTTTTIRGGIMVLNWRNFAIRNHLVFRVDWDHMVNFRWLSLEGMHIQASAINSPFDATPWRDEDYLYIGKNYPNWQQNVRDQAWISNCSCNDESPTPARISPWAVKGNIPAEAS